MFGWYTRMGRYAQGASWLGAFFAVVVSGYSAAGIVEPILPAHRLYVRTTEQEQTAALLARQEKLVGRLILAQLDINRDRRERLLEDFKRRDLELQSPEVKAAPGYEALVKDHVERVKKELDKLDVDDKSLFNEQTEDQKRR